MKKLLPAAAVVGLSVVLVWSITRARRGSAPAPSPRDAALEQLRAELGQTPPRTGRTDADRFADALAWVRVNRPAGWPYAGLEARVLADYEARARAEPRSIGWALDTARQEVEWIRALDADLDGVVSEEEIASFAEFSMAILEPENHPYLLALFDTDGDGQMDEDYRVALNDTENERAGLLERARFDLWDTDNDGVLSDAERTVGAAIARSHQMPFEDGHTEYIDTPPKDFEAVQQAVLDRIAEQSGPESADLLRNRIGTAADHQLAWSLNEQLALIERDRTPGTEPSPPSPDWASFNTDGDPDWNEQELAVLEAARIEWERTFTEYQARSGARRMARQFERLTTAGDADGDGLLLGGEWDDLITSRLADRDNRLLMRSYDTNGNDQIEVGEVEDFLGWFRTGSIRADANFDGRVDALDLETLIAHFRAPDR